MILPDFRRWFFAAAVVLLPALARAGLVHAVNSGGGAASPFAADASFSGGTAYSSASAVNVSGVAGPAPQSVYQTERYGNFTYTFAGLVPGNPHTVRLHFAETYHSTANSRRFHVSVNGTQILTNYDIFAEAGGKNIAVVEEIAATANPSGQIVVQFSNGAADNAKASGIEILDDATPAAPATRVNMDFDKGSAYSGTAAAPDTGTVWNTIAAQSTASHTLADVLDSTGGATPCDVTVASSGTTIKSWSEGTLGNPVPTGLMSDYLYGNTYTVTVSELPAGNYYLYVYAHGDQANQSSTVTVSAANGGGSAVTGATGTQYRNLSTAGAEGYSYLKFQPVVGASGTLVFTAASYLNGFQLISHPAPVFTAQPPPYPTALVGSTFNLPATATGDGTITYQWRKGGADLADGPTGNGSTYAGTTGPTLTVSNVQAADGGDYDVVATNPGGSTTSTVATLATSSTPQAPEILSGPANGTIPATETATFAVVVNGTSPLTFTWTKNGAPVTNGTTPQGSVISGADGATLMIANAALDDAGTYQVTVTNPVGSDSASATLTVNQGPVILTQPQSATVNAGVVHTLSATFGAAFPALAYQWGKSPDGIAFTNVSGATGTSLTLTASAATSGFYRVTATNSTGSVTSNTVHFGIPSAQAVTFAPSNNAAGIAIDQPLRLIFPDPPRLGSSGIFRIHDASNNTVVASIDRSTFQSYSVDSITLINASTQTQQGSGYYYLPIAIHGNEVWVTPGTAQRLSHGKTYYVTMDAGLLLDAANQAVPAITDPNTWRFTTRDARPGTPTASTGPAILSVAMDGGGDFATLQGALDWIPQNNTLPRTILVEPGIYREAVHIGQNRRFVTIAGTGASRGDVVIHHPSPATDNSSSAGVIRVTCDDVTLRNLTLDCGAYLSQPNPAGPAYPVIPAFPGRINVLLTTGKRLVCEDVVIKGGQDSAYTHSGICYFKDCEIWGSVDFIYGAALAVFEECDIVQVRATGGPIAAPSTDPGQPHGIVFLRCRFPRALTADGFPYNVDTGSTTFMRPWRKDAATGVIECQLDTHLSTKAWSEWGGREATCRAREYGNTMPGGGAAPTTAQRQTAGAYWLNSSDPDYNPATDLETDADVAPPGGSGNRQTLAVDPADYTLAAIFGHPYFNLGGWLPETGTPLFTDGYGSTATGGAGGTVVTVTTAADLVSHATSPQPRVIRISGTIDITGAAGSYGKRIDVTSHKTIEGVDGNAGIIGNLNLGGSVRNVIIRRLHFTHPGSVLGADGRYVDGGDGISIAGASEVHVTHCSFRDCADGTCDISHGADYVTVSWCRFSYSAAQTNHRFAMILGNTTASNYHATLHHNWFAEGCNSRMPSGSYSRAHLYNNYFSAAGNSYCTNVRTNGQFRVENSYYQGVNNPCYKELGGRIHLSGSVFNSCTGYPGGWDSSAGALTGNDAVFFPPYAYTLDTAAELPALVMADAGNGAPSNTWTAWRLTHFNAGQIAAGLAEAEANPDGDGLANLAEYALGTNPHFFTPLPSPVRDGSGLSLVFTRPQGLPGVTYLGESSENLGTWTELPVELIQPGDPETVRVRDPLTSGDPALRFLRLRFEFTGP